jgi:cytoplasmic tRNA 2-thiolation protein 1
MAPRPCARCNVERAVLRRPKTFEQVHAHTLALLHQLPWRPHTCLTPSLMHACLHGRQVCRECFYAAFEQEIHETIVGSGMYRRGDRVAIGASGGKDSTVLAHIMTTLNARHE